MRRSPGSLGSPSSPGPESKPLEGFRHVVWDWNGTLLDDHEHCVAVINGMLREDDLPEIDGERYREIFDFPVERYYERLGFDLGGGRWEALAVRFIEAYDRGAAECRLHSGALELLDELGRADVESSILSAARRTSIEAALDERGIRGHFRDVVGLDDHYARGKLHRGLEWIGRSSAARAEIVVVGDTVHDFEVARAMGVRSVLVAAGHQAKKRLEQCGCPVVDSLESLLGVEV